MNFHAQDQVFHILISSFYNKEVGQFIIQPQKNARKSVNEKFMSSIYLLWVLIT